MKRKMLFFFACLLIVYSITGCKNQQKADKIESDVSSYVEADENKIETQDNSIKESEWVRVDETIGTEDFEPTDSHGTDEIENSTKTDIKEDDSEDIGELDTEDLGGWV